MEYIRSVDLVGDTGGFPHSSVGKSSALLMQETRVRFLVQEDPLEKGNGGKWQPTPVFLPGEAHGQRSLVASSPWGRKSWTRLGD